MSLLFTPVQVLLDQNGDPVPGGKISVFRAGTTTLLNLFSDSAMTNARTNPIVADASGRYDPVFFAGENYKMEFTDANDASLGYPAIDNIPPLISADGGALPIASGGTGGTTAATARTALGAASQADLNTLSATATNFDNQLSSIGGTLGAVAAAAKVELANMGEFADLPITRSLGTNAVQASVPIGESLAAGSAPAIGDGVQVVTGSITPKRSDSELEFNITIPVSSGAATAYSTAYGLFRTTTNSLVSAFWGSVGSTREIQRFTLRSPSPGAAANDYQVRAYYRNAEYNVNVGAHGNSGASQLEIIERIDTPVA